MPVGTGGNVLRKLQIAFNSVSSIWPKALGITGLISVPSGLVPSAQRGDEVGLRPTRQPARGIGSEVGGVRPIRGADVDLASGIIPPMAAGARDRDITAVGHSRAALNHVRLEGGVIDQFGSELYLPGHDQRPRDGAYPQRDTFPVDRGHGLHVGDDVSHVCFRKMRIVGRRHQEKTVPIGGNAVPNGPYEVLVRKGSRQSAPAMRKIRAEEPTHGRIVHDLGAPEIGAMAARGEPRVSARWRPCTIESAPKGTMGGDTATWKTRCSRMFDRQ